jgi:hypothetical protein
VDAGLLKIIFDQGWPASKPSFFSEGKSPDHLSVVGSARHAQVVGTFALTVFFWCG